MEVWILLFVISAYLALWLLGRRPNSLLCRAATTWFGPLPTQGESWSRFQLRWAAYSLRWLIQIAVLFCALWFVEVRAPEVYSYSVFQLLWFALPLGFGMALLASIGFLAKAAKAHYIGPNPVCRIERIANEA